MDYGGYRYIVLCFSLIILSQISIKADDSIASGSSSLKLPSCVAALLQKTSLLEQGVSDAAFDDIKLLIRRFNDYERDSIVANKVIDYFLKLNNLTDASQSKERVRLLWIIRQILVQAKEKIKLSEKIIKDVVSLCFKVLEGEYLVEEKSLSLELLRVIAYFDSTKMRIVVDGKESVLNGLVRSGVSSAPGLDQSVLKDKVEDLKFYVMKDNEVLKSIDEFQAGDPTPEQRKEDEDLAIEMFTANDKKFSQKFNRILSVLVSDFEEFEIPPPVNSYFSPAYDLLKFIAPLRCILTSRIAKYLGDKSIFVDHPMLATLVSHFNQLRSEYAYDLADDLTKIKFPRGRAGVP